MVEELGPGPCRDCCISVREADFALYLQHVGDTTASKSAVEEAVNAIGWVQQLVGYPPVSDSPFMRMVADGMQRQLAKPKARKEPVSSDMIAMLVNSLSARPTPTDVRLVAECLPVFSAFLRYDELAKLRCCDITFCATHVCAYNMK